jgi:hypothetical protein
LDDGAAGCTGEAQEGLQKGLRLEPLVTRIEIVSRHRATGRATARTKLHFKSPTAESLRRHVLCVGVGGDRTHAARPQGSRVCAP